jgi:hypothetical protein
MAMKRITIATALLGLTSPVSAADPFHATIGHLPGHEVAFITNYAAWSALSDEARAAYAAAALDQFIVDAPFVSTQKTDDLKELINCVHTLGVTPKAVARLISDRYAQVPDERNGSPAAVLTGFLAAGDFCGLMAAEMETGK